MDVDIAEGVEVIMNAVFQSCTSLTHITIPSTVKSIGGAAFAGCTHLENVSLSNSLESIVGGAFDSCTSLTHIIIPASVSSLDSSAFPGCSNLSTVVYLGSAFFSNNAFPSCGNIKNVCVPPNYSSTTFGGLNVTSNNEVCQSFFELLNDCSTPVYKDDHFVEQKRKNTTEWESQTDECMEYKCVKDDGFVSLSTCYSTDKTNRVCVNHRCIDDETIKKTYVEVELDEGVKATEVNVAAIIEAISALCEISSDLIEIGYVLDSNGNVLRVLVFVGDEQTANIVLQTIQSLEQGSNCKAGILCRNKRVSIVVVSQSISAASTVDVTISTVLSLFLLANCLMVLLA